MKILSNAEIKRISKKYEPDFEIKNNNFFQFIVWKNILIPSQGWKIHISAYFNNYKKILKLVFNYCLKYKISFKYIQSKKNFYFSISALANRTESGKYITIYPKNKNNFINIIKELYIILKNEKGPYILSDNIYEDCQVLYYRYGIIGPNKKMLIYKGNKFEDKRLPYYNLPAFVNDPFHKNIKNQLDKIEDIILNNKYLIENVIWFSNAGGIYLGKNLKTGKKLIFKEARPFIGDSITHTNIFYRKNEMKIMKLFDFDFFPKYIDNFYENDHFFIVCEYIQGKNLANYLSLNSIFLFNLKNNKKKFTIIKKNLENISYKIINIVETCNKKNLFLNDIKIDNFIIKNNKIFFIDLENSYIISSKNEKIKIVKNKLPDSFIKFYSHKKIENIKLAFIIINLYIDLPEIDNNFLSIKKIFNFFLFFCNKFKISIKIVKKIHLLLFNSNFLNQKNKFCVKCEIDKIMNYIISNQEEYFLKVFFYIENIKYIKKDEDIFTILILNLNINKIKEKNLKYILNIKKNSENLILNLLLNIETYKKNKDLNFLQNIKKIIKNIEKKFILNKKGFFYFKYNIEKKEVLSPYLIFGISGYILCLIEIYLITKKKFFLKYIKKYSSSVNINYTNKWKFKFGYLGNLFVLIKLCNLNLFKNSEVFNNNLNLINFFKNIDWTKKEINKNKFDLPDWIEIYCVILNLFNYIKR